MNYFEQQNVRSIIYSFLTGDYIKQETHIWICSNSTFNFTDIGMDCGKS